MKLQFGSDLHLEFGEITCRNKANSDVLVLLGDICVARTFWTAKNPEYQRYVEFFTQCSNEFSQVVYVLGNHEYYKGLWHETLSLVKNFTQQFKNIHVLEGEKFEYKDVSFVGGTLWTDMNGQDPYTMVAIKDLVNDFRMIGNENRGYRTITASEVVARHMDTLAKFKDLVKDKQKVVVCSHHLPSAKSIPDRFITQRVVNGAYSSELSSFILQNPQIKLWLHGHTHDHCDYNIGSTRVIANPRGYHGYEPQAGTFEFEVVDVD